MLPRNNADVTHCEKTVFCFQNKAVYRAEDRPADIRLKMSFTRIAKRDSDLFNRTVSETGHVL